MLFWTADIISHLNSHGFNLAPEDPCHHVQENTRYRFLRMSSPMKTNGMRFRLYTDAFPWVIKHRWKDAVKPLIVDASRPNWKRSVDRWVSLAVMTLAEANQQADEQESEERRKYERRLDSARALIANTGISVADVVSTFGFEWGGNNYDEVVQFSAFMLKPRSTGPLPDLAAKVARLIVFMQQEGWIDAKQDDLTLSAEQQLGYRKK